MTNQPSPPMLGHGLGPNSESPLDGVIDRPESKSGHLRSQSIRRYLGAITAGTALFISPAAVSAAESAPAVDDILPAFEILASAADAECIEDGPGEFHWVWQGNNLGTWAFLRTNVVYNGIKYTGGPVDADIDCDWEQTTPTQPPEEEEPDPTQPPEEEEPDPTQPPEEEEPEITTTTALSEYDQFKLDWQEWHDQGGIDRWMRGQNRRNGLI